MRAWGIPQELKLPCKQPLQARFNRADESNESKWWRSWIALSALTLLRMPWIMGRCPRLAF